MQNAYKFCLECKNYFLILKSIRIKTDKNLILPLKT